MTIVSFTDMIRVQLPKILPPSYRGTSIRYFYYVHCTISGRWLVLENGHHNNCSGHDLIKMVSISVVMVLAHELCLDSPNKNTSRFSLFFYSLPFHCSRHCLFFKLMQCFFFIFISMIEWLKLPCKSLFS